MYVGFARLHKIDRLHARKDGKLLVNDFFFSSHLFTPAPRVPPSETTET